MCRLFWRTPPPPAGPDASVCGYVGYYLGPVGRNPAQNFAVGPGFLGLWRRPLGACAGAAGFKLISRMAGRCRNRKLKIAWSKEQRNSFSLLTMVMTMVIMRDENERD